jgi:hypothetical protein
LKAFGADFYFYGSSPMFMTNWSWYKTLPLSPVDYNEAFISAFRSQRQSFLHYDETSVPDQEAGESMYQSCREFSLIVEQPTASWLAVTPETVRQHLVHVQRVQEIAERCGLRRSAAAIREFLALFADDRIPDAQRIADMVDFRGAFGRGQQYVSLVRA